MVRKKTQIRRVKKRNCDYLKPPAFKNYLTLAELCDFVNKQPKWIKLLEKEGRIPTARRVKRGKIELRLWSPAQAEETKRILATHRPGRPSNG